MEFEDDYRTNLSVRKFMPFMVVKIVSRPFGIQQSKQGQNRFL